MIKSKEITKRLGSFLESHKNQPHIDLVKNFKENVDIDALNTYERKEIFKHLVMSLKPN